MTGFGSVQTAVTAMRLGADDYLQKPFTIETLKVILDKALENQRVRSENLNLKSELLKRYGFHNIIGRSEAMQEVFRTIEKAAPTKANILIHGESGTGKEMIARAIHAYSPRKEEPFIGVDCVAIPSHLLESELFGHEKGAFTGADSRKEGLLEAAGTGTFFMDEVTEISYDVQAKLLRTLQEREFRRVGGREFIRMDTRIVAATKRDPLQAVNEKIFREDLYYRLNVIPIELPPLRERKEDIPLLIRHFLREASLNLTHSGEETHIDSEALTALPMSPRPFAATKAIFLSTAAGSANSPSKMPKTSGLKSSNTAI
jgi:DNA-binding NtrC family response regulator